MADTGIEYLDEIGLILNIMVLGFMLLFLIPTMKQRDKVITAFFSLISKVTSVFKSDKEDSTEPHELKQEFSMEKTPWDRRIGAWLVVWLLIYLIHIEMSFNESFDWLRYSGTNTDVMKTEDVASWFNFIIIGTLLMLLIPIPFLRRTWMVAVFAGVALFTRIADQRALEDGFNSNYSILFVMACSMICVTMGIRLFLFLPDPKSKEKKHIALRRSGFFALGAVVILSDFMVFLVPGFFNGSSHTWWYSFFMNWSVVQHGYDGLLATHLITATIMGIFSFMMISLGLSSLYHLALTIRKKRKFGVPGIFAVYFILMWVMILVRFITIETELAAFNTMTGAPELSLIHI